HGTLDLRFAAAKSHQYERGDDDDFEPHVKVEDIARKEGPIEAHQQEMEDGEIAIYDAAARNAGGGENRNGKPRKRGEQHHAAAEHVGHEGDAEGRVPAGGLHGTDAALPHGGEQPDSHQHTDGAARNADDAMGDGFTPKEQQQDGCEQMDKNGENNGIVNHISSSSGVFKSSRSSELTNTYTLLSNTMANDWMPKQIGRASCRERVDSPAVAVSASEKERDALWTRRQ